MEKEENKQRSFGLVGKDISYSFSRGYFTKKFEELNLKNHSYVNYDLPTIQDFEMIVKEELHLTGLNVTIPYKEAVIPYLAELDPMAAEIGAVNTISFTETGLKGYNTDAYGFKMALQPLLKEQHKKALILGTGGASKAIAYILSKLGISYTFVSRTPSEDQLGYDALSDAVMAENLVIINCTPIGTFPDLEAKPAIPYEFITEKHLLFDLIYNPERTAFLLEGEAKGATVANGLKMLEEQAERAWAIWTGN
ncbi:MAG: shikimate dehydrogenase [Flavobacteriaceae bacterium]